MRTRRVLCACLCACVKSFTGDEELTDEEIHDRDISWLQTADGRVVML